jgi:hypothetical protein
MEVGACEAVWRPERNLFLPWDSTIRGAYFQGFQALHMYCTD